LVEHHYLNRDRYLRKHFGDVADCILLETIRLIISMTESIQNIIYGFGFKEDI
jgi:hypothetical protein